MELELGEPTAFVRLQSAVGAVKIHLGPYTTWTRKKNATRKVKEGRGGGEQASKENGEGEGGEEKTERTGVGGGTTTANMGKEVGEKTSAIQGRGQPHERPKRQLLIEGSPAGHKREPQLNHN